MKRITTVFLSLAAVSVMFFALLGLTGCSESEADRTEELSASMKVFYNELDEAFPEKIYSFEAVTRYLADWAEAQGLEVRSVKDHYIIISNPSTKGTKDADFNVIQCTVDTENVHGDLHELSLAMAALLGPVQHGRIKLIVTESVGNLFPGAADLKKKSIKGDHFIQIRETGKNQVYTRGALESSCTFSTRDDMTEPEYTNAFLITFTMDRYFADPYLYDKKHRYPNPAEIIGELLASAKSSGRLFEVASFEAESEDRFIPHTAKAVVVIDDNNVEAFQKRFERSFESVEDKFEKLDEASFTYTMEETEMPEKVLDQKISDNLISLMYTIQTGPYIQNEDTGTVYAASYIKSISTKNGKFRMKMDMRSLDEPYMEEMSANYQIAAGLSDVSYKAEESGRIWTSKEGSIAASYFSSVLSDESKDSDVMIRSSECDEIWSTRPKTDLISCWYEKSRRKDMLAYLLNFMDTDPQKEPLSETGSE